MLNALFLKEIRERKVLFLLGLFLSLSSPLVVFVIQALGLASAEYGRAIGVAVSWIFLLIFILAFPILLSAPAFAGEVENGTLPFLLSLPSPRRRIWWTKFFACWTILHAFLLLFLLTNHSLGDVFFLNNTRLQTYIWSLRSDFFWRLVPFFFPTLLLALSLAASTLSNRETTASSAGLLLPLLTVAGAFVLLSSLYWDMTGIETILFILLLTLFFLYFSLVVFWEGELLDTLSGKLRVSGRALLKSFPLAALGLFLLYAASIADWPDTSRSIESFSYLKQSDSALMQVSRKNSRDARLWKIPLGGGPVLRYRERFAENFLLSPDEKKAAFLRQIFPEGPVGNLLGFKKSELVLLDLMSGKSKKILGYSRQFRDQDFLFWLGERRLLFVMSRKNKEVNRIVTTLTVTDDSGKVLSQRVLAAPGEFSPFVGAQMRENALYLLYSGKSGLLAIRVEPESGLRRTVISNKNEGGDSLRFAGNPVSPEEDCFFFFRKHRNGFQELCLAPFKGGREKRILLEQEGLMRSPIWLGKSGLAAFIMLHQGLQATLFVVDVRSGKFIYRDERAWVSYRPVMAWNEKTKELAYTAMDNNQGPGCALKLAEPLTGKNRTLGHVWGISNLEWAGGGNLLFASSWRQDLTLMDHEGHSKILLHLKDR